MLLVTRGFITQLSRRKGELPPPRASSSHRDRELVATGAAKQLGSAGRALKRPVSIAGLSRLLESAQARSIRFIATFALDVQIAELNRDEWATLYKLPCIKASPWRLWSLGPLMEEVFIPEIAASPVLPGEGSGCPWCGGARGARGEESRGPCPVLCRQRLQPPLPSDRACIWAPMHR